MRIGIARGYFKDFKDVSNIIKNIKLHIVVLLLSLCKIVKAHNSLIQILFNFVAFRRTYLQI